MKEVMADELSGEGGWGWRGGCRCSAQVTVISMTADVLVQIDDNLPHSSTTRSRILTAVNDTLPMIRNRSITEVKEPGRRERHVGMGGILVVVHLTTETECSMFARPV